MSGAVAASFGVGPTFHVHTDAVTSNGDGGPITASIQYQTDGDIQTDTTDGNVDVGDWISPRELASGSYTIRAHVDSGSVTGDTEDSDLALSSSRGWTVTQSGVGSSSATLTITLKLSGTTVKSGQVTLSATRNS